MSGSRIGIIGGSFDPIHIGHLIVAQSALEAADLDTVVFIPCGRPPHKDRILADPEDRYRMVELAIGGVNFFDISRIELDRSGTSYTVETLRELRRQRPDDELFFITGDDSTLDILTWRSPREIVKLSKVISIGRPGYSRERLKELPDDIYGAIIPADSPMIGISSTEIRKRIRSGLSIRFLVPDPVCDYIYKKELYCTQGGVMN